MKISKNNTNNVGNVYIHLSNIFDYQATAFYYSLKTRVQLLNNFISLIKATTAKGYDSICRSRTT